MSSEPKNRKARRQEAKQKGEPFTPLHSGAQIPLSQPDRSGPKGKTLFDIADERNALISKGQPFSPVHSDGLVRDEQGRVILPAKDVPRPQTNDTNDGTTAEVEDTENPIGPFGDALFLTTTLTMLHFTLTLLVQNQYNSKPPTLWPVFVHTLPTFPILFVFVYLLKLPPVTSRPTLKQATHFVLGVGAGCYLLWIGNRENYLGVMKRAPPVGAVWVWNVVEMNLIPAVASLGVCVAYLLWNGFSIY